MFATIFFIILLLVSYLFGVSVQLSDTCRNTYNDKYNQADFLYPVSVGLWVIIFEVYLIYILILNILHLDTFHKKLKKLIYGCDETYIGSALIFPIIIFGLLTLYYCILYDMLPLLYKAVVNCDILAGVVIFISISASNCFIGVLAHKGFNVVKDIFNGD